MCRPCVDNDNLSLHTYMYLHDRSIGPNSLMCIFNIGYFLLPVILLILNGINICIQLKRGLKERYIYIRISLLIFIYRFSSFFFASTNIYYHPYVWFIIRHCTQHIQSSFIPLSIILQHTHNWIFLLIYYIYIFLSIIFLLFLSNLWALQ